MLMIGKNTARTVSTALAAALALGTMAPTFAIAETFDGRPSDMPLATQAATMAQGYSSADATDAAIEACNMGWDQVEGICRDRDSYDKGNSVRIITCPGDCWDFWVDAEVGDVYPVA